LQTNKPFKSINWNKIEDLIDKMTWEKLTSQFWLATRMPISNDTSDWKQLSKEEQTLFNKVLGGLTALDTLQSQDGVAAVKQAVRTPHEFAVYNNIEFMESVHAQSYSSIFSTLCSVKEIEDIFRWTESNPYLQYKAKRIQDIYLNGTDLERKVASVYLESFLFYSGFYTPLYYLGLGKMVNVAEVIRLILRDESVHGSYIGYKFSLGFKELPKDEQDSLRDWAYQLLYELYDNECKYTEELYDDLGMTEDVKVFLRYNANKALQNLRFDTLFPDTSEDVNPIVMNGISTGTSNQDFFSSVGNGYLLSPVEDMKDSDYDII